MLAEQTIAPDHPVFAGHFPAHPVVPGALLLDWACHSLGAGQSAASREARFPRSCGPGSRLVLRAEPGKEPSSSARRFAITTEDAGTEVAVVTGTLGPLSTAAGT